jgi:vitamin B12 transporter
MISYGRSLVFHALVLALALPLVGALTCARAEDMDDTDGMFSAWQEQPAATATRAPKPLSRTAENSTVITAPEIEALNAHTLADVLMTVPGIQTRNLGGAGEPTSIYFHTPSFYHVLVLVDGVPLNNLGDNYPNVAMVPARIIQRIEIVKGAASSAWGQALGGVVNVITKAPEQRAIGGAVTAIYGEGDTVDASAELTGTQARLGYYLSGGYLGFRDIPPHITNDSNSAYAKLTYDLPGQGRGWATFSRTHANYNNFYVPTPLDMKSHLRGTEQYASLGLRRRLRDGLELELSGRHSSRDYETSRYHISSGLPYRGQPPVVVEDDVYGASAKLTWRMSTNLLVLGGDYEHARLSASGTYSAPLDTVSRSVDRWGVYLNDTLTLGRLAITPGARFDRPRTTSDQFSPSLGITWQLSESSLLRGYTGRGYGLWSLSLVDTPAEKVWTSQIGVESTLIPYLWQKLTLFRDETWNFKTWNAKTKLMESDRRLALGVEYEIRTTPLFNTSLGAGYTFTDTELKSTDSNEAGVARHTVQLAVRYDDRTFRGALTGRHIFWNSAPAARGDYGGMIWDLHLGATLLKREEKSLELLFSGHNLFDCSQSPVYYYPYPGRWFEGGVRVRF